MFPSRNIISPLVCIFISRHFTIFLFKIDFLEDVTKLSLKQILRKVTSDEFQLKFELVRNLTENVKFKDIFGLEIQIRVNQQSNLVKMNLLNTNQNFRLNFSLKMVEFEQKNKI
jgi:hypothetical protein